MAREKNQRPEDLGPPWTVRKLLRWTTRYFDDEEISDSPRLDAELLLGEVLDMERVELYARSDTTVDEDKRDGFRALVKRRTTGEPVAYLVGHRPFWQMELKTDERALVPRPETEVLVERVLEELPDDGGRLADIGTGAGPVALALAGERPSLTIAATDIDPEALALARENARRLGLDDRVDFFCGDLLDPLPEDWRPLDAVVSNPPYVPDQDRDSVMVDVREHEPDRALFAGPDGLDVVRRLVPNAAGALSPGGLLALEIGHRQADPVVELLEGDVFSEIEVHTDYGDRDRVVTARRTRRN